jgi:putative transposase
VREFIEEMIRGEFDAVLSRPRYGRQVKTAAEGEGVVGHRHGSRTRTLTGTFGETTPLTGSDCGRALPRALH